MRVSTVVACTGFASLGLVAAGLLDALPSPVRVALALAGLVLVPAWLLLRRQPEAGSPPPLSNFALAVITVLSAHALLAEAFVLAGAPLRAYSGTLLWVSLVGYVVWIASAWRGRNGPARRFSDRASPGLWVCLVLVAALARPAPGPGQDAFDHIGYLRRAIVHNQMQPDGVLAWPVDAHETVAPDPRKGSMHDMLAAVAIIAGAEPETVWSTLPLLLFPVAVGAFGAFAGLFVRAGPAWVVTLALFLLSFAGTLFTFAPSVAYGQHLAVTWYWALACLALTGARDGWTRASLVRMSVVTVGGVCVHAGVAMHAVLLALTLALFAGWLALPRARVMQAAVVVGVCAILTGVWRVFAADGATNIVHAHAQGLMTVGRWVVASPMEILREHGLVFLGGIVLVPPLALVARTRPDARRVVAFSVLPLVIAFVPLVATPLSERVSYMLLRSLLNIPAFAAVTVTAVVAVDAWRQGKRRVVAATATAALTVWALVFIVPSLRAFALETGSLKRSTPAASAEDAALVWARTLPPGTTILSDPATSYRLSAFTTLRFVALYEQHANPLDPFALDRMRTVRDGISPWANGEAAPAACLRYRVDYVLLVRGNSAGGFLSSWRPEQYDAARRRLEFMPIAFEKVFDSGDAVAFRFDKRETGERPAWSPPAPVSVDESVLMPCVPPGAGHAPFELTGVALDRATAAPGDTVVMTLGYRRDTGDGFEFPRIVHVRFDHALVDSHPRYPGEKYVRRTRERSDGSYLRFRADLQPGHGVYEPDLWPMGVSLRESFRVLIPATTRPGRYRVEFRVVEASLVPNFDISDLLFNRDHYSGAPCLSLDVATRGGQP